MKIEVVAQGQKVDALQSRLDVVSVDVTSMKTRQDALENDLKRMRCASSNASTAAVTPSPNKWQQLPKDPWHSGTSDPWAIRPRNLDMDRFQPCIEIKGWVPIWKERNVTSILRHQIDDMITKISDGLGEHASRVNFPEVRRRCDRFGIFHKLQLIIKDDCKTERDELIELVKQIDLSFTHRGTLQTPRVTRQCHPDRLPQAKAQAVMTSFLNTNGIVATNFKIQWTSPMTLLNLTNSEAPVECAKVVENQTRAAGWSLMPTFKDFKDDWKQLPVEDLVKLIDES